MNKKKQVLFAIAAIYLRWKRKWHQSIWVRETIQACSQQGVYIPYIIYNI